MLLAQAAVWDVWHSRFTQHTILWRFIQTFPTIAAIRSRHMYSVSKCLGLFLGRLIQGHVGKGASVQPGWSHRILCVRLHEVKRGVALRRFRDLPAKSVEGFFLVHRIKLLNFDVDWGVKPVLVRIRLLPRLPSVGIKSFSESVASSEIEVLLNGPSVPHSVTLHRVIYWHLRSYNKIYY